MAGVQNVRSEAVTLAVFETELQSRNCSKVEREPTHIQEVE